MSCFNSRAREGRDPGRRIPLAAHVVSIHAPARGATCCRRLLNRCLMFQFTRPRGRALARVLCSSIMAVSIHGPARARPGGASWLLGVDVSIHAPARGATVDRISIRSCPFSIHAPRGARPGLTGRQHRHSDVSITRPRGRDIPLGDCSLARTVSIHAPARGATWNGFVGAP